MRVYTVHIRTPSAPLDRDVVLIKEGFSWPAFFFTILWALWSRLWLVALAIFAAELVWSWTAFFLDVIVPVQAAISLAISAVIGFIANDLKRWTLFRRGYAEVGVVAGADYDAALQRFFDQHTQLVAGLVR